jgi:hypothetical protein
MWVELLCKLCEECIIAEPAGEDQVVAAEKALKVKFPDDLRNLLKESNGVATGRFGCSLVWSVERIKRENLSIRSQKSFQDLYMPFDHLLFFGDSGSGDQFAFAILNGAVRLPYIFEWDHETDSRTKVAFSLQQFLERWFSGTL